MFRRGQIDLHLGRKMNHANRTEDSKGEGFREVERDTAGRVAVIANRQIVAQDNLEITAPLGNHIGFHFKIPGQIRAKQYGTAQDILSLHFNRVPLENPVPWVLSVQSLFLPKG